MELVACYLKWEMTFPGKFRRLRLSGRLYFLKISQATPSAEL
jgi:hypothetical protein